MDGSECECGGIMFRNNTASDDEFLQCLNCGVTEQIEAHNNDNFVSSEPYDGGTQFCHGDGNGARPAGIRYQGTSISEGRKAGMAAIQTLCQIFNASHLENNMLEIFKQLKSWRNLTSVAAAVFVSVYRVNHPISIKQILPVLNVTPPVTKSLLGTAVKKVDAYCKESLSAQPANKSTTTSQEEQPSTSAVPEIGKHAARFVLSNLTVQDPFMPTEEITERVYNITNKIVQVFERRTKKSFDRRMITIAAGFLAWQSCHYYDKKYNSQVPFTELREPKEKSDFQKYLTLTKLDINDHTARGITRNVCFILKELLELFKRMTWIEKRVKGNKDVPKYLELILQFAGMTSDVLNNEEETERLNEPIITPIIPRELTAEEEAILDAPELSEKDFPDAQMQEYIRTQEEIIPTNVHLHFSRILDNELAEMKNKREEKQQKKKKKSESKLVS